MPALLDRLKHLPAHTIVLTAHFGLDAQGTRYVGGSRPDPAIVSSCNCLVLGHSDGDLAHGEGVAM